MVEFLFFGSGNTAISDLMRLDAFCCCSLKSGNYHIIRASWDTEDQKLSCKKNGHIKILSELDQILGCTSFPLCPFLSLFCQVGLKTKYFFVHHKIDKKLTTCWQLYFEVNVNLSTWNLMLTSRKLKQLLFKTIWVT